jgi:hypothetical protein
MLDHAICDHCNGRIEQLDGFLFDCPGSITIRGETTPLKDLFLCQSCTYQTFSDANWERLLSVPKELSGEAVADLLSIVKAIEAVQFRAALAMCKDGGFTPSQARARAHDLAVRWWIDPEVAESQTWLSWMLKPEQCKKCREELGLESDFCPHCGAYQDWGWVYGSWAFSVLLFAGGLVCYFYFEHPATRSITGWILWFAGAFMLVFPTCMATIRRASQKSCIRCGARI